MERKRDLGESNRQKARLILSRPQVDFAFLRNPRQLEDASKHRSTFCELRGAFEQSLRFRSTRRAWTQAYSLLRFRRQNTDLSRTCATRETDVISERKHCSRRRRRTQIDFTSPRKSADKTQPETKNAGMQGRPVAGLRTPI